LYTESARIARTASVRALFLDDVIGYCVMNDDVVGRSTQIGVVDRRAMTNAAIARGTV